jgi:Reverse transcriptase (RNA-dependent DNA polymerase)
LLKDRDLPTCIVRILIILCTGNQVRILWAGLASDYFTASNGVKQGAVISAILFCICRDDLFNRLKLSGVGCYIGLNFTGAPAYADDLVLLSATPTAMHRMLAICDVFAAEYDILFNAGKSKFLIIAARKRRLLYIDMCASSFYIGGKLLEHVNQYAHLGHIITSEFDDICDITHRRNCFVCQVNGVLCFFNKLDLIVKLNYLNRTEQVSMAVSCGHLAT